jgi:uncharacterized protein YjcR
MTKKTIEARKKLNKLYLSGNYNINEIATELGVCRTTLYNWKHKYFSCEQWNKRNEKKVLKYYNSGITGTKELVILTNLHPVSINRFKRKFKEYNNRKLQTNVFNYSILKDDLILKVNKSIN